MSASSGLLVVAKPSFGSMLGLVWVACTHLGMSLSSGSLVVEELKSFMPCCIVLRLITYKHHLMILSSGLLVVGELKSFKPSCIIWVCIAYKHHLMILNWVLLVVVILLILMPSFRQIIDALNVLKPSSFV